MAVVDNEKYKEHNEIAPLIQFFDMGMGELQALAVRFVSTFQFTPKAVCIKIIKLR